MQMIKASQLVEDFGVYPRNSVDSQHVGYLVQVAESGAELPPIVVDKKTNRIADGIHRVRAFRRLFGPDVEMEAILKAYKNDRELFLDAVRLNSNHGRMLSNFDRSRCVLVGEDFGITFEQIASALKITVDAVGKLRKDHVGVLHVDTPASRLQKKQQGMARVKKGKKTVYIPIKNTIKHMAGRELTPKQVKANKKLSGMNQMFYVNQVIILLESGLLDKKNKRLMEKLDVLCELLGNV